MEDRIHIARTEKEYKEGLKNPSKNIMYFPNANQMTMKGMRTPIKYYGITDGRITDEGYAKPGQKFNVNGVSTLEVRAPQMRYGGRVKYQLSGPTPEQVAQAAKELSSKPRNLTIQDEVSDPNVVAMIERVLANPNDPNNKVLLSDPKFLALIDAYRNKPKPITEVLNDLIAVIQTDPTNAAAAVANFQSLLGSYSTKDLETALPLIKQFESRFTPDEFQGINRTINDKIIRRDIELDASNPNKPNKPVEIQQPLKYDTENDKYRTILESNRVPNRYQFKYAPELYSTRLDANGFPVENAYPAIEDMRKMENIGGGRSYYYTTDEENEELIAINDPKDPSKFRFFTMNNDPNNAFGNEFGVASSREFNVDGLKPKTPKPRGTASSGYPIPDWIGAGKEYESVEDYQKAIKEFLKENPNIKYTLAGKNEGVDNDYGTTSHLFLSDPTRKAAFEKWKESKKTVTAPPIIIDYSNPTKTEEKSVKTTTTTSPAEAKKDVTVDGDKIVRYTDPNSVESIYLDEKRYPNRWVQTPMGYVKLNDGYNHLPKGHQVSYNTNYPSVQDGYFGTSNPRGTIDSNDLDDELKRRKKLMDFYPGSLNSSTKRDEMNFGPGISNIPSIPTLFNSKKIAQKLKGAYDKLDEGFDNFTNMMNSDRSDRAARRAERFLARAEAAEAIGNDRQAGRLYRKADRQIARIEPLKRIQDANEARKDFEAQIGLNRMDYRLGLKENRANEKMITAKSESLMSPEYYQNLKYNKQFVQSGNEDRRRKRIEGRYNRAELDAIRKAERNRIIDDSRDFRTGLIQNYKTIKNQYNEEDKMNYLD